MSTVAETIAAALVRAGVRRVYGLHDALRAAFAHDGPALGFGLYGIRSLLSGRGDELLDPADANLVRRFSP